MADDAPRQAAETAGEDRPLRAPYRKPDEVRADLLAATVDLLGEHLPRNLTVRAIASRAGTQHSMITRHYGSKDVLVAEALTVVAQRYRGAIASAPSPEAGYVAALEHVRGSSTGVLMVAMADPQRGEDRPGSGFPGYDAHLEQLLAAGADDDLRTRVLAGLALGTVVAWTVIEDLVIAANALPDEARPEVHAVVEELLGTLVASVVPPSPGPGASPTRSTT